MRNSYHTDVQLRVNHGKPTWMLSGCYTQASALSGDHQQFSTPEFDAGTMH